MTTPTIRICGECGKPLAADGDCPVCAIKRALSLSGQASEAPVTEQPGDRIGRYKLLEKIGEGGYGNVYMAEQTEPIRRRVALKIVKLGMDTRQVIARFEAERQALALMDHPNIAKVMDAGATDTGRPYFVMELVRGIRITDYCDQHSLSTKERLDLFIQVCHAVQHAHQKGIIHRDLKPSNVLVTELDGKPVPKVIDFGIAKATGQQLLTDKTLFTSFQAFVGTPAYMSPEQAEMSGADVDTRSDIYALGVLLYELLTGRLPFDQKELLEAGLDEMRRLIREREPPRPSTRLSSLSGKDLTTVAKRRQAEPPNLIYLIRGDLDWIVMKCLEKDRARRYETAIGLAHDIERHLKDELITARPPSVACRLQKTVRRHRLVFAASVAIAVVLVAGTTASLWWGLVATRARSEAELARRAAEESEKRAEGEARRADAKALEARNGLAASYFMQAIRLIKENEDYDAAAYLAACLRVNPAHEAAATRLATFLAYRSWYLPLSAPLKHAGPVVSAQFSSDGKQIVTASVDKTARVWDAQTGLPLTEPLKHGTNVTSAQFSLDGKRIVTTSQDHSAQIWDTQTGQPVTRPLRHGNWVNTAQFSPDGRWVVTASRDGTARVWDAQTGQPLTEPLKHKINVNTAQFSSDGKRIVTASDDCTARVWDAQTGQSLTQPLQHAHFVNSAEFSPDGQHVVTASADKTARVWDAQTGWPLTNPLKHADTIRSAHFSADGKRVVTASHDQTAQVWDAETGHLLTGPLKHLDRIRSAQFNPDGKRVATASRDHTAKVWDTQTGQLLAQPIRHRGWVVSAQFSPDGKRILTASYDEIARVWGMQTEKPLTQVMKHSGPVRLAQFSTDGKWVVTASEDHTACVWDAQTGQRVAQPFQHADWVYSAQFSPDGRRVVTASRDRSARVWDVQTGQALTEPLNHGAAVTSGKFSPDGKWVVTASDDYTARVWDAQTSQPVGGALRHGHWVNSAEFSPDGKWVVTASRDQTAQVWDAQTGQPLTEPLRHANMVRSARFSPDGKRVVTASWDITARVWDARTGQPLTEPLRHRNAVCSARFSPDGKRVVTTSLDKTARIWDAQTGQPLTEPLQHAGQVASAQFSLDGKRVMTWSDDNTVQVWDVLTGQALTESLRHRDALSSASLSSDGKRVVMASVDHTASIWDVAPSGSRFPDWLAILAEAVCGQRLNENGLLQETQPDPAGVIERLRKQLAQESNDNDWAEWGRWLLADPAARAISPFSKVRIQDYRESVTRWNIEGWYTALENTRDAAARGDLKVINELSWLFATSVRADVRDGRMAVALAEKLVAATHSTNATYLDTLAAAYAEAGRFNAATSVQQRTLGLLRDEKTKQDFSSRLKLYQSNSPYRQDSTSKLVGRAEDKDWRAAFVQTRGALAAQFGLWKEGVRDLAEAVKLSPNEHRNWYQLAPLLVETGDLKGYRQHCRNMLARFGGTNAPVIAERTAKVCLMVPAAKEEVAPAGKLAETAINAGKSSGWIAYFQFVKGLADYRQGNFEQAAEWAKKALDQPGKDFSRDVQAYAVLAMAQQRLNQPDEAHAALSNAVEIAEGKLAKRGSGNLGPAWNDWIVAHTLLREAKGLIEGGGTLNGKQ